MALHLVVALEAQEQHLLYQVVQLLMLAVAEEEVLSLVLVVLVAVVLEVQDQMALLEQLILEVVEVVALMFHHILVVQVVQALSLFLMLAYNNLVVAQFHTLVETLFTLLHLVAY
jgi:hypothetical protein